MLLALTLIITAVSPDVDASKLKLSAPTSIVEFDTGKVKGVLFRLAWSPDAQQIYLQTIERDRAGAITTVHHYLMGLNGEPPKSVEREPAWSAAYWEWKSSRAAPGVPAFKIEVEESQKRVKTTSTPMGGDLAKGGLEGSGAMTPVGGGVVGDAMSAATQGQIAHFYTLKLKGEVVGEFVNTVAVPGLTFGWAPAGARLIAYSNPDGRVVVMDDQGRKQEISSSKSTLLPAWTDDGKRLAYLQKTGKNKVVLEVVDVIKQAP
jgi:hypothetical protein